MENFNDYRVNLDNLIYNARKIKGMGVKLCAMVKANAYGHGISYVAEALEGEVDFFGVASFFEAKKLRDMHLTTPILVVGKTDSANVQWCAENNVSVTVSSEEELSSFLHELTLPLNVHVKIDTGLHRFGVSSIKEYRAMQKLVANTGMIQMEGLFTHFATKGEDVDFLQAQHKKILPYIKKSDKNIMVHCCNSFATLHFPKFHHDMVRCGFLLYGWESGFRPVLEITSRIVYIKDVKKGETVGYDRIYKYSKNGRVAIVPLGYADGFDRRLSNNFQVLVNGVYVNVIGRVCMDIFYIDVSPLSDVKVGDEVLILGVRNKKVISVHNYANRLNTSVYDILLKLNNRRMNVFVIKENEEILINSQNEG